MARTWILQDTRSGAVGDVVGNFNTFHGTNIYFSIDVSGDGLVIKWTPTAFTDISGATFNSLEITGLTIFNSSLYALCVNATLTEAYVYQYSSGTSWTLRTTVSGLSGAGTYSIDSDSSRIVVALNDGSNSYVYASTDGTSWAAQTAAGGSFTTFNVGGMIGDAQGTYSTELVIFDENCWHFSGGNDWAKLNGGAVTAGRLAGFADNYSWFHDGANTLNYSSDWGENYLGASGTVTTTGRVFVQTLEADIEAYVLGDDAAYAYVSSSKTWNNDGTPSAADNIKLLADLGGTIYALVQNGDDAEIYSGGALTPIPAVYAKFYFGKGPGEGVLEEKFTMPFPRIRPGAMTLKEALGTIVIGTAEPAAEAVIYSNYPYVTGTAMSSGHPTGTSISSLKWI